MNLVHRSIFFSAIERYGSLSFFLVSTAILSRLLTPEEFGVYALVNALTAVITASFQEFGGENYLIQKPSLSDQNIRTAFTIIFCLSVLIAITLFALRGPLAWFFSEIGLRIGFAVSALNFLLLPFSMTMAALLRRKMAFGTLARCNLVGALVNALVSIALAVLNYSFLAPLFGLFAGNATVTILLIASRGDLRIFCPKLKGYQDVLNFGAYSSCVAVINVFYHFTPQLILGRILDFTAVGLYSRAINVTQTFDKLILHAINPVILPAISAHTRAGGNLKRAYLNAIELIASVQWPFFIFVAMMAELIIRIWLGSTWIEVVPLIRLLCIASLSLFAACLTYPVLVVIGRVHDSLVSSLISLPPSILAIFIASFFGVKAVAASALLTLPFQAIVAIYFISRHLAITPSDLLRATKKSGIVTACSTGGALVGIAIGELSQGGQVAGLLLAGVFAASGWWLGLMTTKHPLLEQMRSAVNGVATLTTEASFSLTDVEPAGAQGVSGRS